jgi:23S rRNA (guanosine2251-2'-O)-methyltransferase
VETIKLHIRTNLNTGTLENFIFGIRPVIEMLDEGKIPEKVYIQKGLTGPLFQQLFQKVREKEVSFQMVPVEKLNRITNKNHQGIVAQVAMIEYHRLDNLVADIYEKGETPLLVILDKVTDVRNLGAIARSAECAGAHAIIIGEKSSAPVNADAIKTSAGALARIAVCKERDIMESIAFLKESGIKTVACTEKAENTIYDSSLTGPIAIIMGSEDKGISRACLAMADEMAAIPLQGRIGSLNVSVAAGIVLFEILRQKQFASFK